MAVNKHNVWISILPPSVKRFTKLHTLRTLFAILCILKAIKSGQAAIHEVTAVLTVCGFKNVCG